jgi:glycosyltransferase involved in cell wall biosynthesis
MSAKPSRVFFDARFIRIGHHDGISRFSVGLANALVKHIPVTAIVYREEQLRELDPSIEHIYANDPTKIAELGFARRLNRAGAELVYSPMNTTGSLGRRFKLILSQHDLIYFKHPKPPNDFSPLLRLGWRLFHLSYWPQRFTLNRADALVTVSETSKKHLQQHRLFRGEIAVVLNASGSEGQLLSGPNQAQASNPNPAKGSARNKLIYMGSFMPYKNVETLIFAMAQLPELELHLLSRVNQKRQAELMALQSATGGKVIWHNGVTDQQYQLLLDDSLALVSASFDEGFGIPVVEAQSRGIPVVLSDIEIFHEIAGASAHFFNPNQVDACVKAINQLRDSESWQRASVQALKNSKRFTWDNSANDLMSLISRL